MNVHRNKYFKLLYACTSMTKKAHAHRMRTRMGTRRNVWVFENMRNCAKNIFGSDVNLLCSKILPL